MIQPKQVSSSPPRRRFRKFRIALVAVFVLLLGLIGYCVGWYYYHRYDGLKELNAIIAKLDETEPNWRWDDLQKSKPTIPDEENSALRVAAAVKLMPQTWLRSLTAEQANACLQMGQLVGINLAAGASVPAGMPLGAPMQMTHASRVGVLYYPFLPPINSEDHSDSIHALSPEVQLNDKQVTYLRNQLERAALALPEARKLVDMPRGRYPDVVLGPDPLETSIPYVTDNYQIAGLLRYDAILHIQEGDFAGAYGNIRAIINTGHALRGEQFLITQLVRMADNAAALGTLERLLAQAQVSDQMLESLQHLLELEDKEVPAQELIAFRGERAMGDSLYETMARAGVSLSQWRGSSPSRVPLVDRLDAKRWLAVLPHVHATYLQRMTRCVEIAKLPFAEQQAQFALIDKWSKDDVADVLNELLIHSVMKFAVAFQHDQARLRCAAVAMAAERYRIGRGSWPDSVEALVKAGFVPELPVDPFDCEPIRLKRTDDGMIVYCVGQDKEDNGGKLDRKNPGRPGSDIGFQLWDVAKRRQSPQPVAKQS